MSGAVILTIVAFVLGSALLILDSLTKEKDTKKDKILSMLPGINCGACGYGGCEGLAEAISKGEEKPNKCKPLREDKLKEIEKYLNE